MKKIVTILHCAAFITVSCTVSAQKTKLSLKEGQKYQTENTVKTTTNTEMMGQPMDITANVSATKLFEIKAKKQDTYGAALTITKMSMTSDFMGQAMNYDSEKPEDQKSDIGKALKDKLNVPVEMEINDEAKISNVKKDEKKKGSNGAADMMESFGAGADEAATSDDIFLLTPKNLKAGDTWSDSIIVEGMKTYRNFTVKSLQGSDATITISGKQLIEKKMDNPNMEMTLVMETKLTGEAQVDTQTSVTKQKTLLTEGTGNIQVMGTEVPMTTKVETTSVTKTL